MVAVWGRRRLGNLGSGGSGRSGVRRAASGRAPPRRAPPGSAAAPGSAPARVVGRPRRREEAAVDGDLLAGDERGLVAEEEGDERGYLVGPADAVHGVERRGEGAALGI